MNFTAFKYFDIIVERLLHIDNCESITKLSMYLEFPEDSHYRMHLVIGKYIKIELRDLRKCILVEKRVQETDQQQSLSDFLQTYHSQYREQFPETFNEKMKGLVRYSYLKYEESHYLSEHLASQYALYLAFTVSDEVDYKQIVLQFSQKDRDAILRFMLCYKQLNSDGHSVEVSNTAELVQLFQDFKEDNLDYKIVQQFVNNNRHFPSDSIFGAYCKPLNSSNFLKNCLQCQKIPNQKFVDSVIDQIKAGQQVEVDLSYLALFVILVVIQFCQPDSLGTRPKTQNLVTVYSDDEFDIERYKKEVAGMKYIISRNRRRRDVKK